jgi:hypothetical protein
VLRRVEQVAGVAASGRAGGEDDDSHRSAARRLVGLTMRAEIREDSLRIELDPTLDGASVRGVKAMVEAHGQRPRLLLDFGKVREVRATAIPSLVALGASVPGCRVELTNLTIAVTGAMLHQLDGGEPRPPPAPPSRAPTRHLGRAPIPRPTPA